MIFRSLRSFSKFFPAQSSSSSGSESEPDLSPPITTEQITDNILRLDKTFVDYVRITVKSGSGGDGCYTFMQPRGFRSKIPSGGNGGRGGDVYIQAMRSKKTLNMLKAFSAENGVHGQGKDMDGAGGKSEVIQVPLGTIVREINRFGKKRLLANFDEEGKVLVAEGGKGGRGNKDHPSVSEKEKGVEGRAKLLELELKLIADIGLVGYPNAGKTTLLAALTRACPKIASYPFTTLQPYVGVIDFVDGFRISVADMPGIIEGAHAGKGLGHEFLKHIQRTKGLVYVLDINDSPNKTLRTLYNELMLYDSKLTDKPFAVVLNKSDLVGDTAEIEKEFANKALVISAKHGIGLEKLVTHLRDIVKLFE